MRIISKWTDYYDYMAHVYGHDDRPVYTRGQISQSEIDYYSPSYNPLPRFSFYTTNISLRWVCVCGRVYTQWRTIGDDRFEWHWFDSDAIREHFERDEDRYSFLRGRRWKSEDFMAVESPVALDVSRIIGQPVFVITQYERDRYHHNNIKIQETVPNLGEMGFARFVAPDQMYQDLEYFIANTMQPSPDTTVTDNQTDPEKIVGHGFDLKHSFRHRK